MMRGAFIVKMLSVVTASTVLTLLTASTVFTATTAVAGPPTGETKRIADAAAVIRELRAAPDSGVPQTIWERAHCVAVIPGMKKAAFFIGGEFGKGVVSCKTAHGWSGPVFLRLEKGSFGAQIGAESTDVVLLMMNERGVEKLMANRVTLGADASLAAGPVGRSGSAATDAQLTAEILSYSRARGLFAGIDLSGGVLRPDNDANRAFYGHTVVDREILGGTAAERTPSGASPLIGALTGAKRVTGKPGA